MTINVGYKVECNGIVVLQDFEGIEEQVVATPVLAISAMPPMHTIPYCFAK